MDKYRELCAAVMDRYSPVTVKDFLLGRKKYSKVAIMRHDVDRNPEKALEMAKLEAEMGISSTYYFRVKPKVFIPEIITEISKLGHEVGYHYEVVDKAKGDLQKAIEIFKKELNEFREIVEVKTVCMHGNPLTPWDNRDLWKEYDFEKFNIIGEAYLSIKHEDIRYFSDTGRCWSGEYSIKDTINSNSKKEEKLRIKTTDDVIRIIREGVFEQIYIVTHPNRWSTTYFEWLVELFSQNVKNLGKKVIRYGRALQN
ncbi:polysaccharide deacetylase family protein [Geoglobus ahangari]|nr:hypothetical protein [Geoglobus ahangari]